MDSNRAWTLLGAVLVLALLAFSPGASTYSGALPAGLPHPGHGPSGVASSLAAGSPSGYGPLASPTPRVVLTTAHVGIYTTPHTCGSVTLNGSIYANGAVATVSTGAWPITTTPCSGWTLSSLKTGGSVAIAGATIYINGTYGNVSAVFTGPMYQVAITTNPASCGSITLNTTTGTNGQTLNTSSGQFTLTTTPCTGYFTSSLTGSGGVAITGAVATITGSGGISATFQPRSFNLTVDSAPPGCGGATVGAVSIPSGSTRLIIAGTYTYATWGCTGYNLTGVSSSPPSLIKPQPNNFPSTGNITVLGNGFFNLSFTVQIYTLTFLTQPGNGGTITFAGTTYRNGSVIQVPYGTVGTVNAVAGPHYQPTGSPFVLTGGIEWQMPGQSIFVNYSGDLIAQFIPVYYTVVFTTNEGPCALSSVQFNYSTFPLLNNHGARVKWGIYLVSNPSCMGFTFDRFSGDANVGVTPYSGIVWVNGSGAVTVNFSPDWLEVSGWVERWGSGSPVEGATVSVFYGGNMVNQSAPTGIGGGWNVLLVYGSYTVNATAPLFTTAPQQSVVVNGTPTGVAGFVVWINATVGLTTTPTGVTGFFATYPGVLVPIGIFIVAVGVLVAWQMQRKWSRKGQHLPAAPPPSPPGPPGAGGPPGLPPGPPAPYGRPGPAALPPPRGYPPVAQGRPPGR